MESLITQSHDYADAEIVARVRALIGEEIPIAVTHDLHANVTGEATGSAQANITTNPNECINCRSASCIYSNPYIKVLV